MRQPQDDALFALSTVAETLDFAARLRLPRSTTSEQRATAVSQVTRVSRGSDTPTF